MQQSFSAKDVIRYAALPGIRPRMRQLFVNGFHFVPYLLALVYQIVGLLPKNHPYLNQSNAGLFGIRHVVFEAWRNLTFSVKNTDQIILFIVVLCGLCIFFIQLLFLLALLFMQPAFAMPTSWADFFVVDGNVNTTYLSSPRSQDLAYMMLDLVFGVPHPYLPFTGFFESCVSTVIPCQDNFGVPIFPIHLGNTSVTANADQFGPLNMDAFTYFPFPVHRGLHALFAIYSTGLLVIAVGITAYFVATVLAETAQTGTPFGRRFNKTWAPIRIVVAFGLLMPLSMGPFGLFGSVGLNSSQYIVLYAAKYGSAFATNGWNRFESQLTNSVGGGAGMVSVPNPPDMSSIAEFMFVAKVCKHAYEHYALQEKRNGMASPPANLQLTDDEKVWPYALFEHTATTSSVRLPNLGAIGSILLGLVLSTNTVKIRFGVRDQVKYKHNHGWVSPICGEVNVNITDARGIANAVPGIERVQRGYYSYVLLAWYDLPPFTLIDGGGSYLPSGSVANRRDVELACRLTKGLQTVNYMTTTIDCGATNNIQLNATYISNYLNEIDGYLRGIIGDPTTAGSAVNEQANADRLTTSDPHLPILRFKGWAAAGIWYNRIAEMNGSLIGAVYSPPVVTRYPAIMEQVYKIKSKYDKTVEPGKEHEPTAASIGGIGTLLDGNEGKEFATTLYTAQYEWSSGNLKKADLEGNAILDAISSLLGTDGLFDLRENRGTHPLAMLVGIGRSLVESSIKSLGYATISVIFGKITGMGSLGKISGSFFVTIAMLGLTVGFVLYYVIPFLPFIYFFFAVGGWVKGIFEAMVGAPLWALAHIRIDGEGLSGQAALDGYFLIFEVFLRPILIVFGLLASISIFSALVNVLHDVFPVVSENVGGYDLDAELNVATPAESTINKMRSKVDQFFFTVIYAIIVYLLATSSFKMIDTIPNNILRWMGRSVATFGDQREDPTERLVSSASVGSQQAMSKLGGGLQKAVNAFSS